MADKIQMRRDSAADWTSVDPTLANGEIGYETDTGKWKIGDGTTAWTSLAYMAGDADAIHDNVSAEISAVTEKVSPVSGDLLLIEDSAAANVKKRVQVGNLPSGTPADNSITNAKLADVATETFKGRATAGSGDPEDLTLAQARTLLDVTAGADETSSNETSHATVMNTDASGEINGLTDKPSPVGADLVMIEDSAASYAKKKVSITNLPGGTDADAIHDNVSGEIAAVTEKASPVSADLLLIEDSEATNAKKRVQITNLPAGTPADDSITNAKLANMAEDTIKGRDTAGTGDPEDLTATAVRGILNVADGADVTSVNETSHADVIQDGDFASNGYMKRTGAGTYGVQAAPIPTSETAAKCTDALADQTSANETSHADVVQDGDFASDGYLKRSGGAGSYAVQATPIPTTDTAAKCTDATADNTAANETSHAGVLTETGTQTVTNKDLTSTTNKQRIQKSFTLVSPADTDDWDVVFHDIAWTITKVVVRVDGGTSITWNLKHNTSKTGGNDVFSSNQVTSAGTSYTTITTGFNDATVPANSGLWLDIASISGTPNAIHITIFGDED